jgi:hypothetical protein
VIRKICIVLMLFLSLCTYAERATGLFDGILFDDSAVLLEDAILDASRRHALYSYNLANATTPGFKPILFEDDRRELYTMVPEDSEYFTKVIIEHITSKMAMNRGHQSAYYALYRKKFDNWRQIVSLGKK